VYLLPNIRTKAQFLAARLIANTQRRTVPAEEKSRWLGELAAETGWTPRETAEKLGMSYSWVLKYLPDKYKSRVKAEAGRLGGEAKAEKNATRHVAKDEPVEKKKKFRCRACLKQYEEPVKPVNVKLCPECETEFQMWLADRNLEKQKILKKDLKN